MNAWPCVPVVSYSSVNWPGAMRATANSLPLGAVVCCFACLCLLYFFFFFFFSSCVGTLACCGRSSGAVCVRGLLSPFSSSECVILTGRYSIRMAGCCWMRGIASIGGGRQGLCTGGCVLRMGVDPPCPVHSNEWVIG